MSTDVFDATQREQLKLYVRTLVTEYSSLLRAREIARETRLLGAETIKDGPAEFKRHLPDADRLAAVLAAAFDDPRRRRAAAQTVVRLGDEAFHSSKADPRIGEIFRRARAAMNESDWERLASRLGQLRDVAADTGDVRLASAVEFILVCGMSATSGQVLMHRLQAVLGPEPRLRPPSTLPGVRGAAPEPTVAPARPVTVPSTPPPPLVVESRTDRVPAQEPAPRDPAPQTAPEPLSLPARTWAALSEHHDADVAAVTHFVRQAFGAQAAAEEELIARFSQLVAARASLDQIVLDAEPRASVVAVTALGVGATVVATAAADVLDAERQRAAAAAAANAVVTGVAGAEPVSNLGQFEALTAAVRTVLRDVRGAIGEDPGWSEWQRAAPQDLGTLAAEGRALLDHFATEQRRRRAAVAAAPVVGPAARLDVTDSVPRVDHVYLQKFLEQARLEVGTAGFLPLDARSPPEFARDPGPDVNDAVRIDTLAHNVLRFWCLWATRRQFPTSRLLTLVREAGAVARHARASADVGWFGVLVTGLALDATLSDRARSLGRTRRARLLGALDVAEARARVAEIATDAALSDALVHAITALLDAGFVQEVALLVGSLPERDALAGRLLMDAVAMALASVRWGPPATETLAGMLRELGESSDATEDGLGYVEDALQQGPKKAPPPTPRSVRSRQARALLSHLAELVRVAGSAEARINVSIPGHVTALVAPSGATNLEIPLLVRNAGNGSATAIELVVRPPVKPTPPIQADFYAEKHLPFLARQSLEQAASTITSVDVDVEEIDPARHKSLTLALQVHWLGASPTSIRLEVPLRHERPIIDFRPVEGALGEPVDLNDADTLALSSNGVRNAFVTFRDRLTRGEPVRAVVYGRRRRGKSSISRSLEINPGVAQVWLVVRDVLNAAPLRTLGDALGRLTGVLATALRRADISLGEPIFRPAESPAQLAGTFKNWLSDCARNASRPVPVLLLLDEFQRWLSALDRDARLTLLGVLRDFNESVFGPIRVAFVLSGLRNLEALIEASADFKNSVNRYEVPPLTESESLAYLARRIEPALDGRTRLRLHRMSGGNPYLLNRLGLRLQERLRVLGRTWATVLDIDRLFDEDAADSRIDDYVQYMLREDEEDASPTLRQLSALRAVASVLHVRRDYEGAVTTDEVESWLRQHAVPFDPGVPSEHMRQLASIGALEQRGEAFALPGEWLCRRLASLGGDLQPITRQATADLILGRYRKTRALGDGGQSSVWLAQNVQEGGHDVVLKIYRQIGGNPEDVRARVTREADLLSRVRHDCVVKCRGSSNDERHGGVVILDHVDGRPLDELIVERPEYARPILPGGEIPAQVDFFSSLADGLAECHRHRIVHKDLSPRNVLVVQRLGALSPVLIDFGLAGLDGEAEDTPMHTTHWLSPGFVAPEKLAGARRTRASDVWSLGAIMLHALTGRCLLHDSGALAVLNDVRAALPERLASLLAEMLAKDPQTRPSAAVVRDRLGTILEPASWSDFKDAGESAFLEERFQDAADAMLRALRLTAPSDRTTARYQELVRSVADLATSVAAPAEWYPPWIEDVLPILLASPALDPARADRLATQFDQPALANARPRVWEAMSACLTEPAPAAAARTSLLAGLGARARDVPNELAIPIYAAFVDAAKRGTLHAGAVHNFCVERAALAFERDTELAQTAAWLRRARYIVPTPSSACAELQRRFDAQYKRTANAPALPRECPEASFRGAIMGDKEGGHTDRDRFNRFAQQVHQRHPFVVALERVNLQRQMTGVRRPTLLPLASARGLRAADQGRNDVLTCALDDSFTRGEGPLLVRILLDRETTPKQRDAAFQALAEDHDLFDTREVGE